MASLEDHGFIMKVAGAISSCFFESPYFNTVTGGAFSHVSRHSMVHDKGGVLSGIGEAISALTVHVDKGVIKTID